MRDRSDFNDALTQLNRLHQESGEEANSILEKPAMAPIIEFFFQHNLVAMERFLVELMTNQQDSPQLSSCKERHDRTGRPVVCLPALDKTSDVPTFKIFLFLLQLDRLQLTAVCCNRREGEKTTRHKSTKDSRTGQNSTPEDKELNRKLVDFQKRFLIYQMYPKYLAALLCVAAIRMM